MHDQIEALVVKTAQVLHVALNSSQFKAITTGYELILSQLFRGVVENRYLGAHCSENRPLLTPAPGQAENFKASHIVGEPTSRNVLGWCENNRPVTCPSLGDFTGRDWHGPSIGFIDQSVPGLTIVFERIHTYAQVAFSSAELSPEAGLSPQELLQYHHTKIRGGPGSPPTCDRPVVSEVVGITGELPHVDT